MPHHTAATLFFTVISLAWLGCFMVVLSSAHSWEEAQLVFARIEGFAGHVLAALLSTLTAWFSWQHGATERPWHMPALIGITLLTSALASPSKFALPPLFFLAWLGMRHLLDYLIAAQRAPKQPDTHPKEVL